MDDTKIERKLGRYEPAAIEPRWRKYWEEHGTFRTLNPGDPDFDETKPKFYILDMFPYPSGAGLHVGHPVGYCATDIIARYKRMRGFNVLHPMGFDAFGLPSEQYAIEHGVHPAVTTERNIDRYREQLQMLGFSYDWDREIATCNPSYYKFTQWIFAQMFESWYDDRADRARPIADLVKEMECAERRPRINPQSMNSSGDSDFPLHLRDGSKVWGELSDEDKRCIIDSHRLAYLADVMVNWCPALGTVLANEEVTGEWRSARGNHPVFQRSLRQWMLRITKYADRLLTDLEGLDWPESIKIMQRNWIGKSIGAEALFPLAHKWSVKNGWVVHNDYPDATWDYYSAPDAIRIYTTRADTLSGATYIVLAPEHELVEQITTVEHRAEMDAYVAAARTRSDLDRMAETKEKTGVFTGAYAINTVSGQSISIWVSDYVLMGYGTGAVMAVPYYDTRDFEFAKKFDLPIVAVAIKDHCTIDGLSIHEAQVKITEWLEANKLGCGAVNYKLRDWIFSRQKYWGEPFPVLHGEDGEIVVVPESELPIELPPMMDFKPTRIVDGAETLPEPPLGRAKEWLSVKHDGRSFRRDLNTMPQWAGSCWYYLRFIDPNNACHFCDPSAEKYWMPIDLYVGGAEHAVLHLLYARFWHKVLFDLGHVSTMEPFQKLFNQGMIQSFAYRDQRGITVGFDRVEERGEDRFVLKETEESVTRVVAKMSKSLKNVVTPDDVVEEWGADTFRLYEMYMGPLEASKLWNTRDISGLYKLCQRIWRLVVDENTDELSPALTYDQPDDDTLRAMHKLTKRITDDIEQLKLNTAIAAIFDFVNFLTPRDCRPLAIIESFVLLISPFTPHLAEELWRRLGHTKTLVDEGWPRYDEALVSDKVVEIGVQINGKFKASFMSSVDADEDSIEESALAQPKVIAMLEDKTVRKVIVVKGRLVNIVVD